MPSSLIIVALAAAWLVVLVPMVARKRQAVAQTADTELAARVVRSGSGADEGDEEVAMSEPATEVAEPEEIVEPVRSREPRERTYRPGRGGFDAEAAEIAARAKYAFRQRVVVLLIVLAVITAAGAGFVASTLWWLHALVDLGLVGYLGYLRRQVRIEDEIRLRRLARLNNTRARRPAARRAVVEPEYHEDYDDDVEQEPEEPRRELVGIERRPSPASRLRGRAVVVDLDDEDPEFHELDDPGQLPFRRAVGE